MKKPINKQIKRKNWQNLQKVWKKQAHYFNRLKVKILKRFKVRYKEP